MYIDGSAKLDALTSVGGYLRIYGSAKLDAPFIKNLTYKSIDGYLFVIESEKTTKGIKIISGYNCKRVQKGKIIKQVLFVAEKDGFTAHGETIKKAISDVQFKIISEKLKKEPIKKDTIIDIKYYRLITGSCEIGVKSFIDSHGLKESYRADELLPILEKQNAYGLDKFKSLIIF